MTRQPEEQLSFRPMGPDDLPLLETWLAEPHVSQWWDEADETVAAVTAPPQPGAVAVSPWIIELEARPVGFVQWYRVEPDDDWFPGLEIPAGAVGVDLALGDPDSVGRGVGRRALLEFVHHVVRPAAPDATEVWIDPDPRNERAVRSYRAVGFVDTGIDLPDPERPGATRRLMKLTFPGPAFR